MPEPLDASDIDFLKKRRWFAARWNVLGAGMFLGMAAILGWMCWVRPRLVNPLHVANQLETGGISQSTLEFMAVILPLSVLMIFAVLAVMIGFGFAIFANERRYLRIIDRLRVVDSG